ncbi:Histidine acid phosphatase [Mycena venus]|uniref:Histidine acid phosphatase n=1 Tax=Mycena venus TaxID=2733690 RepID=A0A8H6XSL0_9AGAR|nr:Histidine acid phosphatase [Mycena venus]
MPSAPVDKSKSYFPLAGSASDGWSTEEEATATCFCGAVQLKFPTQGPGFVETFLCHCADCRKITASMFASNFIILDTHFTHVRGRENLTVFGQAKTPASQNTMTNHFCSTCGTLMYRVSTGFPGMSILRIGTVDDFHLHETKLKPRRELFVESRVKWLHSLDGVRQFEGMGARESW